MKNINERFVRSKVKEIDFFDNPYEVIDFIKKVRNEPVSCLGIITDPVLDI